MTSSLLSHLVPQLRDLYIWLKQCYPAPGLWLARQLLDSGCYTRDQLPPRWRLVWLTRSWVVHLVNYHYSERRVDVRPHVRADLNCIEVNWWVGAPLLLWWVSGAVALRLPQEKDALFEQHTLWRDEAAAHEHFRQLSTLIRPQLR